MKTANIFKTIFLIILISPFTLNAYSQQSGSSVEYIAYGLRFGIGASKFKGLEDYRYLGRLPGTDIPAQDYSSTFRLAFDAGVSAQIMFYNKLLIQGDLYFSYAGAGLKGANAITYDDRRNTRISAYYTVLSIHVGRKMPVNDKFRFIVGAGPYGGLESTSWLYDEDAHTPEEDLSIGYGDFKKYDFGLSLMGGVEVGNVQFTIDYNHGLVNIVNDDYPLYNRVIKLSTIYFF
ncbi:outer membrane beta-barrel protein [Dysgonomonas sp. ZJ279]|uniref:outer membrane beta-barrel protein n=1 Tax=Dysgonomonas sp. ZJ279 TaxID=2709796 RepID=UPI0013EC424A|nr:outer membrane beta-barrel protein [Dysgonomonas sp. ZJ279]